MQFKKIVLGSIFIILSGLLYQIDKILSYYKWSSYLIAISGNGGFNSGPDKVTLIDNKFGLLFLFIGAAFYINALISFVKTNKVQ